MLSRFQIPECTDDKNTLTYYPILAYSDELITNGNFSNWTTDNPNNWTVTGESGSNPEVTQRSPSNTHSGSGTGAANFFSTTNNQPRIAQTVLTSGLIYEVNTNLTARVSGNFAYDSGFVTTGNNNFVTVGNTRTIRLSNSTTFRITAGAQPNDFTLDDVSVKRIIPDIQITTPSDYIADYFFNSTSPSGQEEIFLQYRIPSVGDELNNGFLVYLSRRIQNLNWSVLRTKLTSGVRGTVTNMLNNDSNTTTGLRIVLSGNTHKIYRWVNATLSLLDTFTDSSYNTATALNIIVANNVIDNRVILTY